MRQVAELHPVSHRDRGCATLVEIATKAREHWLACEPPKLAGWARPLLRVLLARRPGPFHLLLRQSEASNYQGEELEEAEIEDLGLRAGPRAGGRPRSAP